MTSDDLPAMGAWDLAQRLQRRELRAQGLLQACLARIAERDSAVQAFVVLDAEGALAGLHSTGDPLFCRAWTLLGLPCLDLPFTRGDNGLPLGLQLVGARGAGHRLLAWAERAMPHLAA